jgi:hypothetical protein
MEAGQPIESLALSYPQSNAMAVPFLFCRTRFLLRLCNLRYEQVTSKDGNELIGRGLLLSLDSLLVRK